MKNCNAWKSLLQVHPPTGVTHCAVAHFMQLDAKGNLPDLVVTTSSLLQLYSIRSVAFVSPCLPFFDHSKIPEMFFFPSGCANRNSLCREQQSATKGYQLLLSAECQLFGVVESMTVLKNRAAGKQRDAIILAFR